MSQPASLSAGISFRPAFVEDLTTAGPEISFLEVHAENYMSASGPKSQRLDQAAEALPISVHGVSLSIGSADRLPQDHLARLKSVVSRYDPVLVSEHLAWCQSQTHYFNDLLPIPYTEESLAIVVRNIQQAQEFLGRKILIENPSSYLVYQQSEIPEAEFLAEMSRRSGCGLLLDVNNIYVSAHNLGFDAAAYVETLRDCDIGEIHLADHTDQPIQNPKTHVDHLKVDTHSGRVRQEVWDLYTNTLDVLNRPIPTLIERDDEDVIFEDLRQDAHQAHTYLTSKFHVSQKHATAV